MGGPAMFQNPVAFSEGNNVNYPPAKYKPVRAPFGPSLPRSETNIPFSLAVEIVKDNMALRRFFNSDPSLVLFVDDNETAVPFDLTPALPLTRVSSADFRPDNARVVIVGRPVFDLPHRKQEFVTAIEKFVERGGTLVSLGCHHVLPAFPGTIQVQKRETSASEVKLSEEHELAGFAPGAVVELNWQREIAIVGDARALASSESGLPLAVQFQWRRGNVYYFTSGLFLKRYRANRKETKRPALFEEQVQKMIADLALSPANKKMLQCAIDCGFLNSIPLVFSYLPFATTLTSILSQYVN